MLKLFATHNLSRPRHRFLGHLHHPVDPSLSHSTSDAKENKGQVVSRWNKFRLGMRRPISRRLAPSWQEPLPLQTVHSANTTCVLFPELHALYVWLILHNRYCINMHKLHEIVVFAHAANVRRLLSASKCPASRVCCLSLNRVKPLLNHVRSAEVRGKHFQALPKRFPNTIHQHSSKTPVELQLRSDRTLKGSNKT